jgi:hypothetical protein
MKRFATAFAALCTLGAGCGPKATDSGPAPGTDALPVGTDATPVGTDATATSTDATSTDAAPVGTDAAAFVCVEDPMEPNNSCGSPSFYPSVNAGPESLGLCDANDYYHVMINMGETEMVTLTMDAGGGDLDLEIYDAAAGCATIDTSTNTGTATETLMVTATSPGISFRCIHVFPKTAGETNNYTLDVVVF